MDLWTPLKKQKQIKEIFIRHYGQNFDKAIDFDNRIDVRPDTLIYNYKEDPYIFDQKKEKIPLYYTVYFDDIYICGFGEDQSQPEIDKAFWSGMRDAYKNNKIRLNKGLAKKLNDEYTAKMKELKNDLNKKIDSLPDATPVQKMAKETIKRVKNAKNDKPSSTAK